MFIFLISLIIPILCIYIFIKLTKQKKKQKIAFVGPRGTGKTVCLYKICQNKSVNTVPSLTDNELSYNNITIKEIVPKNEGDPLSKYGINDKNTKYFCFIKNADDLFDVKEYFVKFVSLGNINLKNVISLNNEPEKLIKHF